MPNRKENMPEIGEDPLGVAGHEVLGAGASVR